MDSEEWIQDADVVVLGCGPAGLLAAHAAQSVGMEVVIVSKKVRSNLQGAQFLHQFIPGLTSPQPDAVIDVRKVGTKEGYATKVYGDPSAPVSWDNYDGPTPAWNLLYSYDQLWETWKDRIIDREVDEDVMEWASDYLHVVSSVPLPVLAAAWGQGPEADHAADWVFEFQDVHISVGLKVMLAPQVVVYNGEPTDEYYRASRLFGWGSMEYPMAKQDTKLIRKPLRSNVGDEVYPWVQRVGRYGKWEKPVLAHHAYTDVMEHFNAL
jgi:hypothetical protein